MRIIILAGTSGLLGKVALDYFAEKNYDRILAFNRKKTFASERRGRIEEIIIPDFTDENNINSAFENVDIKSKDLLFLYNTIGYFSGGQPVAETNFDDWKSSIDINLNISFLLSKYFSKKVTECAGGSIVFTGAMTGINPEANKSGYSVSKGGLVTLVKVLAAEGGAKNFTVNLIAPGILDSEENRQWADDTKKLIPPVDICSVVNSVFENFETINGNIIEMSISLKNR